jgi:hypothetical protein
VDAAIVLGEIANREPGSHLGYSFAHP